MKKQKKNYYAIHFIDEKRDEIVTSWEECQRKMKGRHNMFKGFMTKEEALAWLGGITKEAEERQTAQANKHRKFASNSKQYVVTLDCAHGKTLDEWLRKRKLTLNEYLTEVIELDMI